MTSGIDLSLLAVTLLDRFLHPSQGEVQDIPEDTEPALVVALVRLAAKYEGNRGPCQRADDLYCRLTETGDNQEDMGEAKHGQNLDDAELEQKTAESKCRKNVNATEGKVLQVLNYDLHWPTPMPFVRRILRHGDETDSFRNAIEMVLVIASGVTRIMQQWSSADELSDATQRLEAAIRTELKESCPWVYLPQRWRPRIRWIVVLLTQYPMDHDWNECRYQLVRKNRRCKLQIARKKRAERSRLLRSMQNCDAEKVNGVLEDVGELLLCHHHRKFKTLRLQWAQSLEEFPIYRTDDESP
ncbi:restless-like transposase [Metarhizium robertsii ARSEF 23]|uniref:Restless-like transposase n=1 Tax=Metarhizium robertsii (strain ARSEF 23 / ATCC MYA-3075) TaxID=655844 RepID=A0A0B2XHD8_METRA|nr:restless-like transposase [Metarhizium robertsii ARSEF 23]KHO11404.1 restless-like transposase [Metarhizium robertsii ARSEF 23]